MPDPLSIILQLIGWGMINQLTVFAFHPAMINDWVDVPQNKEANDNFFFQSKDTALLKRVNFICMILTAFDLLATIPEPDQIDLLGLITEEHERFLRGTR
jgi:hypothetical protein